MFMVAAQHRQRGDDWSEVDFCEWSSIKSAFPVTAAVSLLFVFFQETEHGGGKV